MQWNEQVDHDGFFYHFSVQTDFGVFQPESTTSLAILIHELAAIAAMKKVDTSDVAIESLKQSGKNTITGVKNLFIHPKETIQGAGQGGSSLFNRARSTVGTRELTETEDKRLAQFIGITKSKGNIASKYGLSLYTSNNILQDELDRLAMADYLGGISVGLATSAIPKGAGLMLSVSGTARLLNETINTTSPAELWAQNEKKLLAMQVHPDTTELFLNNPAFSPAQQTILITAMEQMSEVANRDLFVKVGLQASTPEMVKIITEMAVMAASYHQHVAPLTDFSPMARLPKSRKKDGTVVVILPADHVSLTENVASLAKEIVHNSQKSNVPGYELCLLGTLSDAGQTFFQAMGWEIHENAQSVLFPKR